jgi:hypothetical protein
MVCCTQCIHYCLVTIFSFSLQNSIQRFWILNGICSFSRGMQVLQWKGHCYCSTWCRRDWRITVCQLRGHRLFDMHYMPRHWNPTTLSWPQVICFYLKPLHVSTHVRLLSLLALYTLTTSEQHYYLYYWISQSGSMEIFSANTLLGGIMKTL